MNPLDSQVDTHLISLIRAGDSDGWGQFVSRYHGRMLAYATRQVGAPDAEDVVQEAMIGFLRTLDGFRGESSLESWLFAILRRRIIDHYRAEGASREIPACGIVGEDSSEEPTAINPIDPGDSPSVYVRQQEDHEINLATLGKALTTVIDSLKQQSNLRDLMIIEGLFYAGIKNRRLAELLEIDEGLVAVVRHRVIKKLQSNLADGPAPDSSIKDDLLTEVWRMQRPSCPKRTTLGKGLMGILDPAWQQYLAFHVDTLQCTFCLANQEDLKLPTASSPSHTASSEKRIFDSTVGFINS